MSLFQSRWRIATAVGLFLPLIGGPTCRQRPAAPTSRETAQASEPASRSPARLEESGYLLTPDEKAAVDEFLRLHPELRAATDADRRGSSSGNGDVRGLYGIYHPYFVRGDLNDDGILDFVLAFVHRSSGRATSWFSVAVFTGRGHDKGYNPGMFLERDVSLARGDLSIDRDAVLITPDLSDEAVRRYRWDPVHRSYIFVRDDEDEEEAPLPAQT